MTARGLTLLLGVIACAWLAAEPHLTLAANPSPPQPAAPVKEVAPDKTIALLGQPVVGPLGQEVGRVVDVLVDGKGIPQAAVIDFGGFSALAHARSRWSGTPCTSIRAIPKYPWYSISYQNN